MDNKLRNLGNDIIIYTTEDGQVKIEVRLEKRKCMVNTKCNGRII